MTTYKIRARVRRDRQLQYVGAYRSFEVSRAAKMLFRETGFKLKPHVITFKNGLFEVRNAGTFVYPENVLQFLLLQHALGDAVPFK